METKERIVNKPVNEAAGGTCKQFNLQLVGTRFSVFSFKGSIHIRSLIGPVWGLWMRFLLFGFGLWRVCWW